MCATVRWREIALMKRINCSCNKQNDCGKAFLEILALSDAVGKQLTDSEPQQTAKTTSKHTGADSGMRSFSGRLQHGGAGAALC